MIGTRRVLAAVVGATIVMSACASADESSFTSLPAADAQAHEWVDDAVTTAIPGASTSDGHPEGPDSCTSDAGFAERSYSLAVDVPADEVDARTAAVWQAFRDDGFGAATTDDDATAGTAPAPPGAGSPSWSLFLFHDGFRVEIIGSRTEPAHVSTSIVTPCLRTT